MTSYFYYHNGKEQLGPFLIEELKKEPLQAEMLVWQEGTPSWVKANTIDLLKDLFEKPKTENPKPTIKEEPIKQKQVIQNEVVNKPSTLWKIIKTLLILGLIGIVGIFVAQKGFDANAVLNTPQTIDLAASCSEVNDLLISSEVNVTVENSSSRTHSDVTIKIVAYDNNDNIVKEKVTTFDRVLQPNGSLTKPILLPPRVKYCNCIVTSSNPR